MRTGTGQTQLWLSRWTTTFTLSPLCFFIASAEASGQLFTCTAGRTNTQQESTLVNSWVGFLSQGLSKTSNSDARFRPIKNIFEHKSHMTGTAVQMVLKTRPVCSGRCGGTLRPPGAGSTVVCSRTLTDEHEWQADKWSGADDLWQEIWKRDSVTGNGELSCSQKHWRVSPIIETDVPKKIGNLKFPPPPPPPQCAWKNTQLFSRHFVTKFFYTVGKRHNRQITAMARAFFFLFFFFSYLDFLGSRLTILIIF